MTETFLQWLKRLVHPKTDDEDMLAIKMLVEFIGGGFLVPTPILHPSLLVLTPIGVLLMLHGVYRLTHIGQYLREKSS